MNLFSFMENKTMVVDISKLGSLGPSETKTLTDFMDAAKRDFLELEDIRGGLRDLAKKVAEDLGVDKKALMTAARTAYKQDLLSKQEEMATVTDILEVTGNT